MSVRVQAPTDPSLTLSKDRCEPGSVNIPLCNFPKTAESTSADPDAIAGKVVDAIKTALNNEDTKAIAELFLDDGYLRDHLALSWDFHTIKGKDKIADFLAQNGFPLTNIEIDKSSAYRSPQFGVYDGVGDVKGIQFFFNFTTKVGKGQGVGRLAEKDGQWKLFTFFTTLKDLLGHEETTGPNRPQGVVHGGQVNRKNWAERRQDEFEFKDRDPVVLVVGAGQAGLTAAARLKMLGVDTLVVDSENTIGDNWRRRYHQLVLHDPVWYDHMPYLRFPPHWPIFTPKDKLGEWFESYAKLLELNVWVKTSIESTSWDETKKQWTVTVKRTKADGSSETRTFHPKHIIQCTGHSGKKNYPTIKGMENFKGDVLCHSSEFKGAQPNGKGRKAVVVGSCNSGHDITQDFYEKGYDVTMVQRSTTCVISSESITEIGLKGVYDEMGPPVDDADLWLHSFPSEVLKAFQVKVTALQNKHDAKILEGLEKVGFGLDKGPANAGLFIKYFQRGGGYYIDVGGSQLIIDGKVKIKQGQEIDEILPHGLRFADGSELEADEIIFATGYQNMRTTARDMFGDEVADRVGDIWGYDSEGEMRTIWRKTGHPGFWFHGGNLALCRYYSKLLALQIKALEEGIAQY
ncbi:hypothetical protein G647_00845 [Cladophialophora carrionii CBS 160.54]|uniref:FAD/NAD(P)-binding domain-containing protein n=1 Tax=Cladophialophora carrionii CBS 160.54 TaxID=1279043 RepID=V9DP29_9EURO|nr:uncharacterized protein G647_00845 [Cladophialophora carrionii CBS 160.54]ETI28396.1 hypothetical protein G647_00845 [Cladophialophora carrionii CBS 160.54]